MKRIALFVLAMALGGMSGMTDVEARERIVRVEGAVSGDGQDDTAALLAAIEACRDQPGTRVVLPKGEYDFFAGSNQRHPSVAVALENLKDVTIDGSGSTLVFHGKMGGYWAYRSSGIRFENMVIDYARPPFSVGMIVAATDKTFDVEVDEEFPVEGGEPVEAFMDHDPDTGVFARHGLDIYYGVEKTELVAPQTLRVFLKNPANVTTGRLAVLRHQVYGFNSFGVVECEDVTARNITIYTIPGMGFVGIRSRDLLLENFNVEIKPGTGRLTSATADATHFQGCQGTITIRNCKFEGMGDDAINIKSGLYLSVQEIVDEHTVLAQHNLKMQDLPSAGDRMELSHVRNLIPYTTLTVESATLEEDKQTHRLVFQEQLPEELEVTDVFGNATRAPKVRISDVHTSRNRARGFLIQTRDAIIEDCTFRDTTSGGIWVMTEVVHFYESIGTQDIIVRNNKFYNCNYGGPLGEGVLSVQAYLNAFAYPPEPGVHKNIVLENNLIDGSDNAGIFVTGVDGLRMTGNVVKNACRMPTHQAVGKNAIYIRSSTDVVLEGNRALKEEQGPGCDRTLRLGPGMERDGIRLSGNKGL